MNASDLAYRAPWTMGDSGIIYDDDGLEVPERSDFAAYREYCFARDDIGEYPMTYQQWQIAETEIKNT